MLCVPFGCNNHLKNILLLFYESDAFIIICVLFSLLAAISLISNLLQHLQEEGSKCHQGDQEVHSEGHGHN
jgi:hypothetical protein